MTKRSGEENKVDLLPGETLESIVASAEKYSALPELDLPTEPQKPASVYFIDSPLFDTIMFDEEAWHTLLAYFKQAKPDAVVFTNALCRLDRPNYKNEEELTSFHRSVDALPDLLHSEDDELYNPIHTTMSKEFEIADKRFAELSNAIPDAQKLYFWGVDDGFSANRMALHYALAHKADLHKRRRNRQDELKQNSLRRKEMNKERDERKKDGIWDDGAKRDYRNEARRIERAQLKVQDRIDILTTEIEEFKRAPAETQYHQACVADSYEAICDQYLRICKAHGIGFRESQGTLDINGTKIVFKGNGRRMDAPVSKRNHDIIKSLTKSAPDYIGRGITAVVEGNQGTFWTGRFDEPPSPEDINNGYLGRHLTPKESHSRTVHAAIAPLFLDMSVVKDIVKGKYHRRFGGRGASSTKHHNINKMYENGAVGGVLGIHVDEEGLVSKEFIGFDAFKEGKKEVLYPKEWGMIDTHSDQHLGAPNSNYAQLYGAQALRKKNHEPQKLLGKPVRYLTFLNGGDFQEGNSQGWRGAGAEHEKRNLGQVQKELLEGGLLAGADTDEGKLKLLNYTLGLAMDCNFENVEGILKWGAEFEFNEIKQLAKESPLEVAYAGIGTNHAFYVLKNIGMSPYAFLKTMLKSEGIFDRARFDERTARSNAMMIEDYGKTVDGDTYFGPFNMYVHHDPNAAGNEEITKIRENAARYNAPLSFQGHFHVEGFTMSRHTDRPDQYMAAIALPDLQNVCSTDVFKGGRPRNEGISTVYMPKGMKGESIDRIVVKSTPTIKLTQAALDMYTDRLDAQLKK